MPARKSRLRSLSTRRASILVLVGIRHPRLPFGVLFLPCFSFVAYLLAWGTRLALQCKACKGPVRQLPLPPERLGWLFTGMAGLMLRSGSYTLLQLEAPGGLYVSVRLV